jgi:LPS sulfotransferase NodH
MRTHNVSAIHVIRENVLKTYISRFSAKKRKLYHAKENMGLGMIHLPVANLQRNLRQIESEKNKWKSRLTNIQTMEVHYEDILTNQALIMDEMQDFIGVDRKTGLESGLLKINPDKLENLIENYDEVQHCLKRTPYERYLS